MTIEKSPQLAEVKLQYHCQQPVGSFPTVSSPQEAVEVLRGIWDPGQIMLNEQFIVLLLNNAKKCLGWCKISSGGATATIVDPAAVLRVAILSNATSILLAHNHPSGNTTPSQADKNLTDRITKSGKMLGITLEDHIILSADDYTSFKASGIM